MGLPGSFYSGSPVQAPAGIAHTVGEGHGRGGRTHSAECRKPPAQESIFSRAFVFLFFASIIAFTAGGVFGLARSLGMARSSFDASAISSTVAAGGLITLPFPLLIGWLSDRIGRRPLLLLCYAAGAASLFILALSTQLWQFWAAAALQAFIEREPGRWVRAGYGSGPGGNIRIWPFPVWRYQLDRIDLWLRTHRLCHPAARVFAGDDIFRAAGAADHGSGHPHPQTGSRSCRKSQFLGLYLFFHFKMSLEFGFLHNLSKQPHPPTPRPGFCGAGEIFYCGFFARRRAKKPHLKCLPSPIFGEGAGGGDSWANA